MLVNVEKLSNQPVVVVHYAAPFVPKEDIVNAQEQIATILESHEGTLFRIDDLSKAEMDWNAFLEGIFEATRDVPGSMTDERIHGILVGDYKMVKMASESMKQDQYGAQQTPMFHSIDEALNYVKQQSKTIS